MTDGDDQQAALRELARHVAEPSTTVAVLTGAGISTGSGLPDYRGPAGLWRNRRFEELASIDMWRRDPEEFWEFYRMRLDGLRGARPNAAHVALARLERAGMIERVITQNVDGLHAAAGSEPLEVHGSLRCATCLSCGTTMPMDEALDAGADDADGVPRCGCGTALKPGVTLFGELLPPAIEEAAAIVDRCDVLVACGTSLAVHPVAGFAWHVAARGGTLAIVNRGPTEGDHVARLRIEMDLCEALPELVRRCEA